MGNKFRRALSVVLLLAFCVLGVFFFRSTRGIPGVGMLILKQAAGLFVIIYGLLWLYRKLRPRM